jgi:serine/threonine protein kinase
LQSYAEAPQSAVYKAYHKKNPDRPLVLKILKARSLSEARKAHFVQRIEHLRILHDPLVITPISFESKDEVFFLTQEFFSEITLDKWLEERSRISLNDFFEMACALTQALDRVHQAGIIHGGIKPQLRSLPGGGQANEL